MFFWGKKTQQNQKKPMSMILAHSYIRKSGDTPLGSKACHTPGCELTSGVKDCFLLLSQPHSPCLSGPCLMLGINTFPDPVDTTGFISCPKTGVMVQLPQKPQRIKRAYVQRHSTYHTRTCPDSGISLTHVDADDFWVPWTCPLCVPPGPCSCLYISHATPKEQSTSNSQRQHH